MLKVFDALPGSIWLLICALLFTGWATTAYRLQGEQASHTKTQATYAAQVAAAEQSTRIESEKNRAIEQELSRAQETHAQEIATLRIHRDRDRIAAGAVADRLRNAARATAALAGEACADSSSAELREAAAHAAQVLGRVLAEIDLFAGEVAEHADRSRIAGLACEVRYDEVASILKGGQ